MRIACLISALQWRGSGMSLARIMAGLGGRGHEVLVIAGNPDVAAGFLGAGVPVQQLPLGYTSPTTVAAIRRALTRHGAQVVIADKARDARLAVLARRAAMKVIYRYNVVQGLLEAGTTDRFLLRRADLLVFQCRYLERKVLDGLSWLGHVPSRTIYNGFDPQAMRVPEGAPERFRDSLALAKGRALVVAPALLDHVKAPDVAINAIAAAGLSSRVTLVLLGDGPLRHELEALAHARRVDARFPGRLPRDGVLAACTASDVVLHPAREEIFPNAIAEAMGCGAAILASDAGGTSELLGDDGSAGVLAPVDDASATGRLLADLLDDRPRRARLGASAARRLATAFPLSAMIDGYEAAARELSGSGSM